MLAVFSCTPQDASRGDYDPMEGWSQMEVEAMLLDKSEFYSLEFDKPYLFTSYDDFYTKVIGSVQYSQYMIPFDDIEVVKGVDFAENTLVAMTGLASSYISSIEPKFYMKGENVHIDLMVNVADSCRAARKWNLLLKVPFVMSGDEKVSCNISTNQPIKPVHPDYIFDSHTIVRSDEGEFVGYKPVDRILGVGYKPSGGVSFYGDAYAYEMKVAPYLIAYEPKNHQKVLEIVNGHPSAALSKESFTTFVYAPYSRYAGMAINVLSGCEYADVVAPNSNIIKVPYESWKISGPYGDKVIALVDDALRVKEDQATTDAMRYLAMYLNCKAYVEDGDEALSTSRNDYMYDKTKIGFWDFLSIYARHYSRNGINTPLNRVYLEGFELSEPRVKKFYDFSIETDLEIKPLSEYQQLY